MLMYTLKQIGSAFDYHIELHLYGGQKHALVGSECCRGTLYRAARDVSA